jgi:hypothetical protein
MNHFDNFLVESFLSSSFENFLKEITSISPAGGYHFYLANLRTLYPYNKFSFIIDSLQDRQLFLALL